MIFKVLVLKTEKKTLVFKKINQNKVKISEITSADAGQVIQNQ